VIAGRDLGSSRRSSSALGRNVATLFSFFRSPPFITIFGVVAITIFDVRQHPGVERVDVRKC
jgi:hypothetical protein